MINNNKDCAPPMASLSPKISEKLTKKAKRVRNKKNEHQDLVELRQNIPRGTSIFDDTLITQEAPVEQNDKTSLAQQGQTIQLQKSRSEHAYCPNITCKIECSDEKGHGNYFASQIEQAPENQSKANQQYVIDQMELEQSRIRPEHNATSYPQTVAMPQPTIPTQNTNGFEQNIPQPYCINNGGCDNHLTTSLFDSHSTVSILEPKRRSNPDISEPERKYKTSSKRMRISKEPPTDLKVAIVHSAIPVKPKSNPQEKIMNQEKRNNSEGTGLMYHKNTTVEQRQDISARSFESQSNANTNIRNEKQPNTVNITKGNQYKSEKHMAIENKKQMPLENHVNTVKDKKQTIHENVSSNEKHIQFTGKSLSLKNDKYPETRDTTNIKKENHLKTRNTTKVKKEKLSKKSDTTKVKKENQSKTGDTIKVKKEKHSNTGKTSNSKKEKQTNETCKKEKRPEPDNIADTKTRENCKSHKSTNKNNEQSKHDDILVLTDDDSVQITDESEQRSNPAKRMKINIIDKFVTGSASLDEVVTENASRSKIDDVSICLNKNERKSIETKIEEMENKGIPPHHKDLENAWQNELLPEAPFVDPDGTPLKQTNSCKGRKKKCKGGKQPKKQLKKKGKKGGTNLDEEYHSLFKEKMSAEEYAQLKEKAKEEKLQFEASEILLDLSRKAKNGSLWEKIPEDQQLPEGQKPDIPPEIHFGEAQMLEILSHERLKNEKLTEENYHFRTIIEELRDLVKEKNQDIAILENKVKQLHNDNKFGNINENRIENGIDLLDKLQYVYRGEVTAYCNLIDQYKSENGELRNNYESLKVTVAGLLHKKRQNSKKQVDETNNI